MNEKILKELKEQKKIYEFFKQMKMVELKLLKEILTELKTINKEVS